MTQQVDIHIDEDKIRMRMYMRTEGEKLLIFDS